MQKSIASIVSLLLLGAVQSMGCGPFYASPTNIYLYRFLPSVNGEIETGSNTSDFTYMPVRSYLNAPGDNRQANIALWLRQTFLDQDGIQRFHVRKAYKLVYRRIVSYIALQIGVCIAPFLGSKSE